MKYLVMALLCLQMACKLELPKDDKDKDETGKIVYLGRMNQPVDRLLFSDNDVAAAPAEISEQGVAASFRDYDWDFKLGRVTLSGDCELTRRITVQEEDQLQGLLKTFEYCRYEGPHPMACPVYFILTYANVYYDQSILSINRLPLDGCWPTATVCSAEKTDQLKALNEQLTEADLANCPAGVSN